MALSDQQAIATMKMFLPHPQIHTKEAILIAQQRPQPPFLDLEFPDPSSFIARGAWQVREDNLLRASVGYYGMNQWDAVAALIPGRSAIQCRERWMFRISPGLNKDPFEKWEDELIIKERERLGNHWTLIAGQLPGRTSCAVKNRWYSVLRKHWKPTQKLKAMTGVGPFDIASLLCHPVRSDSDLISCCD